MAIDNCAHTFDEITKTILHAHMVRLALASPLPASAFTGAKTAPRQIMERIGRVLDFPGYYVFIESGKPIYVGISRGVIKRLVQHLNFEFHHSASLVYQMACKEFPHKMKRNQAMAHVEFRQAFSYVQCSLHGTSMAFVEIANDLELYLFEVMAAKELDTASWNTFRTH